jgi:NAD(P)-dependent dehydrogenase (short-subunit alcohol dehydrogenase family)
MTKTDALLYAQDRIRVNSVHPGFIWTPLVEELARNSPEGLEAFRRKLDSRHPIGHVGEPDACRRYPSGGIGAVSGA